MSILVIGNIQTTVTQHVVVQTFWKVIQVSRTSFKTYEEQAFWSLTCARALVLFACLGGLQALVEKTRDGRTDLTELKGNIHVHLRHVGGFLKWQMCSTSTLDVRSQYLRKQASGTPVLFLMQRICKCFLALSSVHLHFLLTALNGYVLGFSLCP